jgi:trk system potassium uptake protein TrkH
MAFLCDPGSWPADNDAIQKNSSPKNRARFPVHRVTMATSISFPNQILAETRELSRGRAIGRLCGLLIMLYSISFLPSIAVSLFYADGQEAEFFLSLLISVAVGCLIWWPNRRAHRELHVRDGFLIVTLFWVALGFAGALPFLLGPHMSLTDSVFEAISGFTTTGATVLVNLDSMPRSLLYHRQQMQWLGGMGVIVLAVAILPLLKVGGMQLYRAEASGVSKQEKLTPRVADTARVLWLIYLVLTAACALAYWAAGMSLFDAVGHAFSTVATGGFSTHDASMAYFDSVVIEAIAVVFMLAGGVNFALHFFSWHRLSVDPYKSDPELRLYLGIFLFSCLLVAGSLVLTGTLPVWESFRQGTFQVASILTSTGFTTANYAAWPLHVPATLAMIAFIGGCAGSTAGGIKVLRILLLAKMGVRQLFLLAHPRAIALMKLGTTKVTDEVMYSVWGFFILYLLVSLLLTLGMMAAGLDLESAFGAVMATINLTGPGLGEVASNFTSVGSAVKWLSIFAMLVGRLEVFTLLILFLPAYWRH